MSTWNKPALTKLSIKEEAPEASFAPEPAIELSWQKPVLSKLPLKEALTGINNGPEILILLS